LRARAVVEMIDEITALRAQLADLLGDDPDTQR
jgi:hypothetical protein